MYFAYAQKSPLNAKSVVLSGHRYLKFGLHLPLHQYLEYASSEGASKSVHLHRLACSFVARQCDKNQNFMCMLML